MTAGALLFSFSLLAAEPGPAAAAAPVTPLPPPSPVVGGKRAQPDYDGRAPEPPTAGQVFIWIPRAILYPPHLAAEYLLRRPGVAFTRWADEHRLWTRVLDVFTWNDRRGGVYPIFNIDFGINQTMGVALFWHELGVPASSLRWSASVGLGRLFTTSGQERLKVFRDGSGALFVGGRFADRPDGVFYGLGSDTRRGDKTFYGFRSYGGSLGLAGEIGGLSRASVEVGLRGASFRPSHISGDVPSIDGRFGGPGQSPLPPGFGGYGLLEPRAVLVLDSRHPDPDLVPLGSGVRMQIDGGYAVDPGNTALRFASWGAAGALFHDFSGAGHVVALEVATRFVENLGEAPAPFTELPALGGAEWMRGFLAGRLRGSSTLVATLQYRYPFWAFFDAELFSSVGNAFDRHLGGLRPQRLFWSNGLGVRTTFARDSSIALTLACASNRLDAPSFDPFDSVRFSVGVIRGF